AGPPDPAALDQGNQRGPGRDVAMVPPRRDERPRLAARLYRAARLPARIPDRLKAMPVRDTIKDHIRESRLFNERAAWAVFISLLLIGLIASRLVFLQVVDY